MLIGIVPFRQDAEVELPDVDRSRGDANASSTDSDSGAPTAPAAPRSEESPIELAAFRSEDMS